MVFTAAADAPLDVALGTLELFGTVVNEAVAAARRRTPRHIVLSVNRLRNRHFFPSFVHFRVHNPTHIHVQERFLAVRFAIIESPIRTGDLESPIVQLHLEVRFQAVHMELTFARFKIDNVLCELIRAYFAHFGAFLKRCSHLVHDRLSFVLHLVGEILMLAERIEKIIYFGCLLL